MFLHIGIIHYAIQLAENSLKIMNESVNVHYGDIMLTAAITSCHNSRPTKPCALGSTALIPPLHTYIRFIQRLVETL